LPSLRLRRPSPFFLCRISALIKTWIFLRLALADEIATLAQLRSTITIRPFATTSKYDSPSLDLQEAGKAMHVTDRRPPDTT